MPVPDIHCLMLGLGGPTFITDWAKAVGRFATVTGLLVVPLLPSHARRHSRSIAVGEVEGVATVYVRHRRVRPARLFWRWNARRRGLAMQRAVAAMEWTPDIIHAHFFAEASPAAELATLLDIPLVLTEHASALAAPDPENHLSRQGIAMMRSVYRAAATVFFVGSEQLSSARRLGATGNFHVLPNPVETSLFVPKSHAAETRRLVTVGHLLPRKRHDLLLLAFEQVLARFPDAVLEIIGGGETREPLERLTEELGVQDSVTFHGNASREFIAATLRDATLYVHTSERESFGVVIVEALLSGTPVIAVRCGGVSECLVEHVGLAVDDSDPVSIAGAIIEGLGSHRFAPPVEISRWATERYGSDAVAATLQVHYTKILQAQ